MKKCGGRFPRRVDAGLTWAIVLVLCVAGTAAAEQIASVGRAEGDLRERRAEPASRRFASAAPTTDSNTNIQQLSEQFEMPADDDGSVDSTRDDGDAEASADEVTLAEPELSFLSHVPLLGYLFEPDSAEAAETETFSEPLAEEETSEASTPAETDQPQAALLAKLDNARAERASETDAEPIAVAAAADAPAPASTTAFAPPEPASEPIELAKRPQPAPQPAPAEMMMPEEPSVDRNPRLGGHTSTTVSKSGRARILRVLTGKSLILDLATSAKRVSVANPEVAEVMIISPRQVMINGLTEGETSIIIWDNSGNYTMHSLISGETLQDQVMLEVTVAEINRTAMERHGMDIRAFGAGQYAGLTQYGGVAPLGGQHPPSEGDPPFPISLDGGISWAVVDLKNDIAVLFKQLQDENLARVLAEPKLLASSGKEASFLSGGEIPIVITQSDDTTIEFKEFGTKIEFVPRVREDGSIDLEIASEVSEPDFASGVELFGFTVPAFITRRVETDVSLRDGESLIVAGLIKETKQEIESKMPYIGDVPFLGYFFRSTEFQNDVLELVIVVRPRLVGAIPPGKRVKLPTDRGPLSRGEVRTKAVEEKVSRPRPY